MSNLNSKVHKLIIIGSGPAGHTAGIYAVRAELEPILFEGFMAAGIAAGGQLTTTTDVENYPGFPQGIGGPELMQLFRDQSSRFGTQIITETISKVDFTTQPLKLWREGQEGEDAIKSHAVIIATGATAKKLPIIGLDEYWQKGISACAVCDGALPLFRDKPLVVVGGGDSAAEEAGYLTKYASKVYLVHRRDKLRASQIMQQRVFDNPKIEVIWNGEVAEVVGNGSLLKGVKIKDTNGEQTLSASGLFFAIGHTPNTAIFKDELELDETGYILTKENSTHTNIAGVFACGDVQDKKYRQAITAAGSGCMAALDVEHWLSNYV